MRDFLNLKVINELKDVYRGNVVKGRRESSAEHTWSALILSDYLFSLLSNTNGINHSRVIELLTYHDLVEIYSGDTKPTYDNPHPDKGIKEITAVQKLEGELPAVISQKFKGAFQEFEEQKTIEAQFAKMVDVFDPILQQLSHKAHWDGWELGGQDFLVDQKMKYMKPFPEIEKLFLNLLPHLEKEGYFTLEEK